MVYEVLCPYHLEGLNKCEQFEGDGEKCRNYEKCEKWKETSKKNLMVGNVKDGDKTAEIFMSFYMNSFLSEFMAEFSSNYDIFLRRGFSYIKNDYIRRNCFLEKDLTVQVLNDIKTGYAEDVTDNGELVLQTEENNSTILTIGDIL